METVYCDLLEESSDEYTSEFDACEVGGSLPINIHKYSFKQNDSLLLKDADQRQIYRQKVLVQSQPLVDELSDMDFKYLKDPLKGFPTKNSLVTMDKICHSPIYEEDEEYQNLKN